MEIRRALSRGIIAHNLYKLILIMLYDHDHHCILVKLSITNVRKNKLLFAFKHGVIHGQFISVWHYVEKGYDLMA